jgi:putative DNA primase/helicase
MSIKNYPNWLVWQQKHQPVSALTGKSAGWNRNLATYAEAEQYCLDNPGYQIGLCFSEDLPYIGLDLDACIGENGLEDWARDIILSLVDCMVIDNKSVSGTGVKVVLKCSEKVKRGVKFIEAQQHGDHVPQVELFAPTEGSSGKYFALTSPLFIDDGADEANLSTLSEIMGYDVTAFEAVESSEATAGDTSAEELKGMLDRLDVMNYDSRESWFKMLSAAHHATGGSDEGLEVFRAWSAGDESSYNESDLQRDWDSLDTNTARPITVATIVRELAPEDRPRIEPEADFDAIEAPKSTSRLLGWLLNETTRNHSKVVEQLAIDREGEVIKYVADWDCWIIFDGSKWIRDSKGSRIHQHVKEYITSLQARIPDNGDSEAAAKAMGWVSNLLNYNPTMGVVRQARGERGLMITIEQMGNRPNLLNFRNGTYDLEKDLFRGHEPSDYLFHTCETDYVAGQEATLWNRVIGEIFDGDTELISYVRRLLGYSISGDTSDPVFNIFYGDGANGKSTVVGAVSGLLGEYSRDLPSELFNKQKELHPTYLATLRGARLAVVAEMESDVQLAEATIKKVTSTDMIEARRMREDPWSFRPSHTSVLCTNHLPTVKGSDKGIWRRLKCVPFEVDLTDRKDATIPERLTFEYAGIANWLIEGYREYKQNGIGTCKAVDEATAAYRENEDEFQRMFEDLFTTSEDSYLPVVDALQVYTANGGRLGRKKFVAEVERMGFEAKRYRVNGSQVHSFKGLRLVMTEFGG